MHRHAPVLSSTERSSKSSEWMHWALRFFNSLFVPIVGLTWQTSPDSHGPASHSQKAIKPNHTSPFWKSHLTYRFMTSANPWAPAKTRGGAFHQELADSPHSHPTHLPCEGFIFIRERLLEAASQLHSTQTFSSRSHGHRDGGPTGGWRSQGNFYGHSFAAEEHFQEDAGRVEAYAEEGSVCQTPRMDKRLLQRKRPVDALCAGCGVGMRHRIHVEEPQFVLPGKAHRQRQSEKFAINKSEIKE